jgi:hypothetical protein
MTRSANLEAEHEKLLNAPSVEDQQAECKKDIEKTVNDQMTIMREVVVRTFVLRVLSELLNLPFRRKSRNGLRSSSKRSS